MKNSISFYITPAGILQVFKKDKDIYKAEFVDVRPETNPASVTTLSSDISFNLQGTPLQLKVWHALREIPQGSTVNYQDLAIQIGHPKAWRAVANAVGKNPIAYLIPCHRVIRKDGTLGGYRWGIHKKQVLLLSERVLGKKTPKV